MREILFKAKRIDNGEWVEGFLLIKYYQELPHDRFAIQYKTKGDEYEWTPKYLTTEIDPETVCQYTGLTDKNGNKIWENDIVCINDAEKCVVRWRFGAFEFLYRVCANSIYAYAGTDIYINDNTLDIKVIGNIFDSPDLLDK